MKKGMFFAVIGLVGLGIIGCGSDGNPAGAKEGNKDSNGDGCFTVGSFIHCDCYFGTQNIDCETYFTSTYLDLTGQTEYDVLAGHGYHIPTNQPGPFEGFWKIVILRSTESDEYDKGGNIIEMKNEKRKEIHAVPTEENMITNRYGIPVEYYYYWTYYEYNDRHVYNSEIYAYSGDTLIFFADKPRETLWAPEGYSITKLPMRFSVGRDTIYIEESVINEYLLCNKYTTDISSCTPGELHKFTWTESHYQTWVKLKDSPQLNVPFLNYHKGNILRDTELSEEEFLQELRDYYISLNVPEDDIPTTWKFVDETYEIYIPQGN